MQETEGVQAQSFDWGDVPLDSKSDSRFESKAVSNTLKTHSPKTCPFKITPFKFTLYSEGAILL